MSGRLDLRLLRRELDRLLAEVETRRGSIVGIEADHYWLLESSEMFDVLSDAAPAVGQISDDLSELEQMASRADHDLVPWHDLKHLIGLLEALAASDLNRE